MSIEMPISFYVSGGGNVSGESGANILKDLKSIVSQIESSGITKLKFGVDTSGINSALQKQTSLVNSTANYWQGRFKDSVKDITATDGGLKQLNNQYKQLENASNSFLKKNLSDIDYRIKARELEGSQFSKQLKAQMQSEQKAALEKEKAQIKNERTTNSLINTETQNVKVLNQAIRTYQKYEDAIKRASKEKGLSLNNDFQSFIKKIQSDPKNSNTKESRKELAYLEKQLLETGVTAETTLQKLQRLFGAHLDTAIAMIGIHLLQKSLREIISTVKELDSALVDLQIATGYSRDKTRELIADYSELGKQLGATTAQVAAASNDWLRQGYSVEQSNVLIKDSMMLSKLGQLEASESTTALTSAMRGYGVSVEDTVKIVDKLVSVDMKAAVSAGDIATAMAETATGAKLAGVELDTLVGYITTVKEVTQDGAESVGIFLKTLFARMGNVKMGRLSDPETEEDLSGVETVLSGVGIALRDANDKFRDFDVILNEVAANWDNYSNVQQRAIAVAFSGTRNQEKFLVLMEHYDEAMKYAEIATNSAGTALDKYNNTYLKGVEAAQNRAKASFEALSTTILNSDLVAGGFNASSGILEFLNSILSVGDGVIVKIGAIIGAYALLNKAITLFNVKSISSVGRAKMTALFYFVNMPTNDLMVTWNELAA